jgi:hypothetical protein
MPDATAHIYDYGIEPKGANPDFFVPYNIHDKEPKSLSQKKKKKSKKVTQKVPQPMGI